MEETLMEGIIILGVAACCFLGADALGKRGHTYGAIALYCVFGFMAILLSYQ